MFILTLCGKIKIFRHQCVIEYDFFKKKTVISTSLFGHGYHCFSNSMRSSKLVKTTVKALEIVTFLCVILYHVVLAEITLDENHFVENEVKDSDRFNVCHVSISNGKDLTQISFLMLLMY